MRVQAEVNRFVLDYLRHGPVKLDSIYAAAFNWGYVPRGMVNSAMMQYGVLRLKNADDGVKYVALPENLVAIWWTVQRSPMHHAA